MDDIFQQALALHRQGRLDEAAALYESILRERPGDFDATYHLSLLRSVQGRLHGALDLATRAVHLQPGNAAANSHAGAVLVALDRPREALPYLERANSLNQALPDARNNYGAALRGLERLEDARRQFARALALQPDNSNARFNLAGTLAKLERFDEALPHYEYLLAQVPDDYQTRTAYARALWRCERLDDAIAAFEQVIAQEPNFADVWANYGNAMLEAGRLETAREALDRAIALDPERPEYLRYLADIAPEAIAPDQVRHLKGTVISASSSDEDFIEANFCLSKLAAVNGDRLASFEHLAAANARRRLSVDYDEAATLASFERIAAIFTRDYLESRAGCGDETTLPIFIAGMPRSGTTLIEQILASHPDVYGAGELSLFEDAVDDVVGDGDSVSAEAMLAASCDTIRALGRRYAENLRARAPSGVARVTDKMPANFRYFGLIAIALPKARLIHAKRDPADTCLSCFEQNFAGGQGFAYDLAELGRYYRGYQKLTAHWRSVLSPDALLEVQYEDVVADIEAQARRIVAFCGLDWDERCLEFYRLKRPVRTASVAQVRRPIYNSSVHKSRQYGDLLKPLLDELEKPTSLFR